MSKHKRRSITVEGETYQWLVSFDAVFVWHRKMGRKSWDREYHSWYCRDPVTPRDVAEFIYREFLNREPPPRPVYRLRMKMKTVPVPVRNTAQPDVYMLVRVFCWFAESGWLRTSETIATVAGFTDPQMAKIQAERLNPPFASVVQPLVNREIDIEEFRRLVGPLAETLIDKGFAVWKAVAMPLYDTTQTRVAA